VHRRGLRRGSRCHLGPYRILLLKSPQQVPRAEAHGEVLGGRQALEPQGEGGGRVVDRAQKAGGVDVEEEEVHLALVVEGLCTYDGLGFQFV
jgi:hypothetical protein